jgi:Na+/H+ antiporter NhaC
MTAIDTTSSAETVRFRGGWGVALVPLAIFLVISVTYFAITQAFSVNVLVAAAMVGILIGGLFARDYKSYWAAVFFGIGSPTAATVVAILFVVGMYSQLIKITGLSDAIAWLSSALHVSSGWYILFVFLATCVISISTGSSIGAMVTAFPVFYAAGIPLGASTVLMGGAIVSGALFGDNLAPISDTTVLSASTQRFRRKTGYADPGGVASSRARYALLAAGVCAVIYAIFGFIGAPADTAEVLGSPAGLWMLIPVVVMLVIAFVTRDIFAAITTGMIVGVVVGLVTGLLPFDQILGSSEGVATGFLVDGVASMIPLIALALSVFAIMGVMVQSGLLTRLTDALLASRWARTPRGAEAVVALSTSILTVAFGGVNGAAFITIGPVVDQLGARVGLHPYRRSNIMDCFGFGIACVVPVASTFLLIASGMTMGFDVPPLTPVDLFFSAAYPLVLTVVMIIAIVTGWGRRFEGEDGRAVRTAEEAVVAA